MLTKTLSGLWIGAILAFCAVARADEPKISPPAKDLIDGMAKAYQQLDSLNVAGTVTGNFDVAGEAKKQEAHFTASYAAPNLFRHDMSDDVLLGSTGQKFFGYQKSQNAYISADSNKGEKPEASALPSEILQILQSQDPNILLALIKDPAVQLTGGMSDIALIEPSQIAGVQCQTLICKQLDPPRTLTLSVDSSTHLIKQMKIDVSKQMERAGASDVKEATITVLYTRMDSNADRAKDRQFAWAPPDGAKDLKALHSAGLDISQAAAALVDKPAPDFTLDDINGKSVHLADLHGQVVVLDFWATWCAPCVASLPKLDAIYRAKSAEGLKGFAVNLSEDKSQVQEFVTQTQLSIPVLLDSNAETGGKYGVDGIPQTVVIGKDGRVKHVFVGGGIEVQLRQAIDEAMK